MKRINKFAVLMPSLSSGTTTVVLSAFILGATLIIYTQKQGSLYRYIFGPSSSTELVRGSEVSFSSFYNLVFGSPLLNKILYFVFWMLVGLVVYMILYVITRSTSTAADDIKESWYANVRHDDALKSVVARALVRLFIIVIWILYVISYFKLLAPGTVALARHGGAQLDTVTGWLYIISAYVLLVIFTHLHFIFGRLVALRTRVFDSDEVLEEDA